ncbi:hypothetical protein, partial [Paracoccus sp. MC1862]|uniref:hypothetical protein n=1 Tax=Paracoccus sp. MC1862 TaxID=2760307 RepID=UPI001C7287A7
DEPSKQTPNLPSLAKSVSSTTRIRGEWPVQISNGRRASASRLPSDASGAEAALDFIQPDT